MTAPKQWAIRDVALATFFNIATGKALFHLQNLKTSGLENAAETVYATGGRGNARIVGFSSTRTATINLEDAVFTNEAIAMMTGNNLVTGAKEVYKRDVLTVATNKVTLSKTPVGNPISVYELNADGSHGEELTKAASTVATGEYSITGKELTFFAGELPNGKQVVVYYKVTTDASAETITISSDKFAGSFKLILDCIVRDAFTKQDFAAQITVHNCKMEDSWSLSMAADGDPSTFTMPIEVLKPSTGTDMWTMTVYDEGAIV